MNSQSILEQKEQNWRYQITQIKNMLKRYSNQDNMILASKQTHTPMKQNRVQK
jgi:hypothetical protein